MIHGHHCPLLGECCSVNHQVQGAYDPCSVLAITRGILVCQSSAVGCAKLSMLSIGHHWGRVGVSIIRCGRYTLSLIIDQ